MLCCDEVDLWRAAEGIDELEEPDFATFSVYEDLIEGGGRTENCPISPVSAVVLGILCTASGANEAAVFVVGRPFLGDREDLE